MTWRKHVYSIRKKKIRQLEITGKKNYIRNSRPNRKQTKMWCDFNLDSEIVNSWNQQTKRGSQLCRQKRVWMLSSLTLSGFSWQIWRWDKWNRRYRHQYPYINVVGIMRYIWADKRANASPPKFLSTNRSKNTKHAQKWRQEKGTPYLPQWGAW